MIIAERKPVQELLAMVATFKNILMVGCKGCVTVCNAGGKKEVAILSAALRLARRNQGNPLTVDEMTLDRQCEPEFITWLEEPLNKNHYEAVISLACSVGPQYIAQTFTDLPVFPGLNTGFMGGTARHGIWEEYCAGCGHCGVHHFGGLCPVTRCAKNLSNGPCGGSEEGMCEVNKDQPCIWEKIYVRMQTLGTLDLLKTVRGAKDWSVSLSGGPRKIIREDLTV
ncbi:MAG: methylenetetrahydrofolate reductase C-terminal domain-containing protein [Thermodesulfobacteriota bacterium]